MVRALFHEYMNAYLTWWAREGLSGRPTYLESRRALEKAHARDPAAL